MIVVDASLATKWFLAEADSVRAISFLERSEADICGPDILGLEVCRALVAATNARRIDAVASRAAIATFLDRIKSGQLRLHSIDWQMLGRATDLAIELGHPLPDCIYLVLAIDLDCDLATCDAKFQAKAADIYPRVKLLSDFS